MLKQDLEHIEAIGGRHVPRAPRGRKVILSCPAGVFVVRSRVKAATESRGKYQGTAAHET